MVVGYLCDPDTREVTAHTYEGAELRRIEGQLRVGYLTRVLLKRAGAASVSAHIDDDFAGAAGGTAWKCGREEIVGPAVVIPDDPTVGVDVVRAACAFP